MVKFKKGLLVITLVSLIMLSIRPFSIYADTISSSNIIGVEYSIESYTTLEPDIVTIGNDKYCNVDFTIKANVKLDNNYFGVINGTLTTNYYDYDISNNTASLVTRTNRTTKNFYVNGNVFSYSFTLRVKVLINSNIQSPISNGFFSIISSDVDIKDGYMNQWNFPMESYSAVYPLLRSSLDQVGIKEFNNYTYPIFSAKTNDILFSSPNSSNTKYDRYLIFAINKNLYNLNTFSNFFNWNTSDAEITFESIITSFRSYYDTTYYYIVKFKIHGLSSNTYYISAKSNFNIMPIYFDYVDKSNISTDFALQFGLSNQLLNDLNVIAQGTINSNNSASSLESSTSSFSSTASDVYNVEDQVSSGFSSSIQNIPSSFNFQNNFGSSFVVSASWVRDQFNNMTANNPFGSLITFSLILGVALLIIGRLLS